MNTDRIEAVAEALAELGHDGIAAFDRMEPEYEFLQTAYDELGDETYVKLLGIIATTQDFQLNGDAQRFWATLTDVSLEHGELASVRDVEIIVDGFMERPVNARFTAMKRDRLDRLFASSFPEWFVEHHREARPIEVWNRLADGLDTEPQKKTVVLAMKIYDIAHLIEHERYLEFPRDIPIPCDLQVERVSRTSGIIDTDDSTQILEAWGTLMTETSEILGRPVSLLRIDSIIWQAGQIIGKAGEDWMAARDALVDHLLEVGVDERHARELAAELTYTM